MMDVKSMMLRKLNTKIILLKLASFVLIMVTYASALSVETVGSGTKTAASMVLSEF